MNNNYHPDMKWSREYALNGDLTEDIHAFWYDFLDNIIEREDDDKFFVAEKALRESLDWTLDSSWEGK